MSGLALERRTWLGAGLAAAVLLVVVTWLVVISPSRADSQQLRDDTESVRLQNVVLSERTAALRQQAEHRGELRDDLEQALAALPAQTRLPELSRQLARQAQDHEVSVISISVGTPTAPVTATPDPAAAGLLVIPVTVVSDGPAIEQLRFLRDVQRLGPRRALVTDSSLSSKDKGSVKTSSTLTVQLSVFTSAMSAADRARLAALLNQDGSD